MPFENVGTSVVASTPRRNILDSPPTQGSIEPPKVKASEYP